MAPAWIRLYRARNRPRRRPRSVWVRAARNRLRGRGRGRWENLKQIPQIRGRAMPRTNTTLRPGRRVSLRHRSRPPPAFADVPRVLWVPGGRHLGRVNLRCGPHPFSVPFAPTQASLLVRLRAAQGAPIRTESRQRLQSAHFMDTVSRCRTVTWDALDDRGPRSEPGSAQFVDTAAGAPVPANIAFRARSADPRDRVHDKAGY